jgi:sugar lactone lactonase YvrE
VAGSEADAVVSTGGGPQGVEHGEGAFWDDEAQVFRHVDMLAGDLMTIDAGGTHRRHVADVAALVRRRRAGGFVIATEDGFLLLDEGMDVQRTIPVFDDPSVRMNEGACDAAGRLFCGSMAYDLQPGAGTVYRLDPDLSVHVALEGVTIPNGLVWDAAGTTAFHADTGDDAVHAYDYDVTTGTFGARDAFVGFHDRVGSPDGMALDVEGGLWVAMWGGSAVLRFDRTGVLTDTVPVPVSDVTSCAFGGPEGRTLLVTTSRVGARRGREPRAGETFRVEVGVAGAPVHRFAG